MTPARACISIILLITAIHTAPGASALEALDQGQMKHAVAQAGISIAMSDVIIENHLGHLTVSNPDAPAEYISFQNIHALTTINTGLFDMNGDGLTHHLAVDVGVINDQVMFIARNPDFSLTTNMTIGGIDFCGTAIGSLSVQDMTLSNLHLAMGPHAGSNGIDFELEQRLTIGELSYGYNSTDSLTFTGITLAQSFTGGLQAPNSWAPTGAFTIGDVAGGNPATIDIVADNQTAWNFTDANGVAYSVDNPRYNTAYLGLNLPMSGSVRVENISFGGNNMGLLAIDNLNAQKLYIEIPGRGLGNTP